MSWISKFSKKILHFRPGHTRRFSKLFIRNLCYFSNNQRPGQHTNDYRMLRVTHCLQLPCARLTQPSRTELSRADPTPCLTSLTHRVYALTSSVSVEVDDWSTHAEVTTSRFRSFLSRWFVTRPTAENLRERGIIRGWSRARDRPLDSHW